MLARVFSVHHPLGGYCPGPYWVQADDFAPVCLALGTCPGNTLRSKRFFPRACQAPTNQGPRKSESSGIRRGLFKLMKLYATSQLPGGPSGTGLARAHADMHRNGPHEQRTTQAMHQRQHNNPPPGTQRPPPQETRARPTPGRGQE